jgi:hypothetical protein
MTKEQKRLFQERRQRRSNLVRGLRNTWSSLSTHLLDSVDAIHDGKQCHGNQEWNSRCVREYGETIYFLSVELHELAKIDFPADYCDYDGKP